MVLTVEPGIYIGKECHQVDPRWRGIGIRIEDDVLIKSKGYTVLSADVPKTTDDIEALMAG
jgi:Xaa-Pro aminopeptidase